MGCARVSPPPVVHPAHQPVTAVLRVNDVEAASQFYERVLSGTTSIRLRDADGALIHVEMNIADGALWIDRSEDTPRRLDGVSGGMIIETPHSKSVVRQLRTAAAATVESNRFIDPFGHVWVVRHAKRARLIPFLVTKRSRANVARAVGAVATRDGLQFAAPSANVVELKVPDHRLALETPRTLGGAPFRVHLYVESCDDRFAAALAAGNQSLSPPRKMYWGDRWALVEDADGHEWGIGERLEQLSAIEMQSRLELTIVGP